MNAPLPVFLTAYDPAELPGGTVDPLGFTSGYLALADAFFPGMTAAAAQATYFPMLCAGLVTADSEGGLAGHTATGARKQRIEVALRFERLWALACGLQEEPNASAEVADLENRASKVAGLRGVRYVQREVQRLAQARAKQTGTKFPLLAHQYRYGAFGIYGGVAETLRLLHKSSFAPTVGFGETIGRSFLEATCGNEQRKQLVRAALDADASIRVETLRAWGQRAYAGAPLLGDARTLLAEAIVHDPARARMLEFVEAVVHENNGEWSDAELLEACAAQTSEAQDPRLFCALHAALAYDYFLRHVTLIFERVLWLCGTTNDTAETRAVFGDSVIQEACAALPERATALLTAAELLFAHGAGELRKRDRGILELVQTLASPGDVEAAVRTVLRRHSKIQASKLERGRPKQAFVQERGTEFILTSAGLGGRAGEPTTPAEVRAPDWRFGAALSMLGVTGRLPAAAVEAA